MADNSSYKTAHENIDSNIKTNHFKLEERDVPGAELPKPSEQCSKAILKRWLSCRGAKVSGNKKELIQRVNNYVNNNLDKDIIDPDGGLNIQKKKADLGLSKADNELSTFPDKGFEVGFSKIPNIGYSQIWKYLIEDVEFKKQLSVEKPIVKGYNFYKSGKVLGIYTKVGHGVFYIKSQVMPSYAKSGAAYTVKIVIGSSSNIQIAHCPCPAGIDGRCNHLAATLFAIEDNQRSVAKDSDTDVPCTSKPCKWSVPPKKHAEPTTIQEIKFEKHIWKKKENIKPRTSHVERAPHKASGNHDFNAIHRRLKEIEEKKGNKIGLAFIIPHDIPTESKQIEANTHTENPQHPRWVLVSPLKDQPLSLNQIAERASKVKQRLFESSNEREAISKETLEQQNCRIWYDVRQPRITASQCKRCLLRATTSPTKAIEDILMYGPKVQTQAMKDGIESEPRIIERFMNETGHKVRKTGFVISESHPFLGASPDGITEEDKLVEVKKVTSKEGENLASTMCRLSICKTFGSDLTINRNHKYFHQIQQQLFCTKLQACHFIVSNGNEMHSEIVLSDSLFWAEILPKLELFYFQHIFPELVYPRVKCGGGRWNKTELPFPRMD